MLLPVFKRLVKEFGIEPNLRISPKVGNSVYRAGDDTIHMFTAGDNFAETVFTLLHEYRHALQVHSGMFPEMFTPEGVQAYSILGHYNVPWEQDANDWAYWKGIELGFWYEGFKPRWLYGVALGNQGAC